MQTAITATITIALVISPLALHALWMAIRVDGLPFNRDWWTAGDEPREEDDVDRLLARVREWLAAPATDHSDDDCFAVSFKTHLNAVYEKHFEDVGQLALWIAMHRNDVEIVAVSDPTQTV